MNKQAYWLFKQTTNTYWFQCSNCGYGAFDGWTGNQKQPETCPKCKAAMSEPPKQPCLDCIHLDPCGYCSFDSCKPYDEWKKLVGEK